MRVFRFNQERDLQLGLKTSVVPFWELLLFRGLSTGVTERGAGLHPDVSFPPLMPKYSEPFGFEYHTQRLRGQLEEIQDDLLGASSSSGAPSALAVAPPTASAPSAEGTAAEGTAASAEGAAASSTAAPSALSKSKGKSRARDDTTKPTRNKKSRGVDPVAVRAAEPESYYEVSRAVHFLAVSTGTGRASYDAAAVAYNTEYLSGYIEMDPTSIRSKAKQLGLRVTKDINGKRVKFSDKQIKKTVNDVLKIRASDTKKFIRVCRQEESRIPLSQTQSNITAVTQLYYGTCYFTAVRRFITIW